MAASSRYHVTCGAGFPVTRTWKRTLSLSRASLVVSLSTNWGGTAAAATKQNRELWVMWTNFSANIAVNNEQCLFSDDSSIPRSWSALELLLLCTHAFHAPARISRITHNHDEFGDCSNWTKVQKQTDCSFVNHIAHYFSPHTPAAVLGRRIDIFTSVVSMWWEYTQRVVLLITNTQIPWIYSISDRETDKPILLPLPPLQR